MAIITLTTDMGDRDFYVASVKGTILSKAPDARIVDISHHISPFDIAQASFVLKHVYKDFPKGTIHIIGVNPDRVKRSGPFDMRDEVAHVVALYDGHYFIAADNGIFSLLFDHAPESAFEITILEADTFPVKHVFAPVATMLLHGTAMEEIGLPHEELRERAVFRPVIDQDMIKGTVIYIDTYGNVITNIVRELFEKVRMEREFSIIFRSEEYEINEISKSYNEVPEGEKIALFGSHGHLEIAINKGVEGSGGGASSLFGLKMNDTIRIEFRS